MPPTSIDGTDITGATIDGTDVTEITVDGQTVFSAEISQPPSGVGYWEFDDNSDTSTATDVWGSNDGTVSGASFVSDAKLGPFALEFDGTNDFVNVGTGLNPDEISVAFYMKTSTTIDGGNRMISKQLDSSPFEGWWFSGGDSNVGNTAGEVQWNILGSSGQSRISSTTKVDDDTYHHVVGVYDRTEPRIELYIDGSSENSTASDHGDAQTNAEMQFGQREDGVGSYPGKLDDVRIYNKALSDSEVSDLFNNDSIL